MKEFYVCQNCGLKFPIEEAGTRRESRGEWFGFLSYEDIAICPECGCEDLEYADEEDDDDESYDVDEEEAECESDEKVQKS